MNAEVELKISNPNYRILPDGRGVPTSKGRSRTLEEKTRISKVMKGRIPTAGIEARKTVWYVINPFMLRNASSFEIVDLTDFSLEQVQNAVNRKRQDGVVNYTTSEWVIKRKKRADRRRGETESKIFPSLHQANTIKFARSLLAANTLSNDTTFWDLGKNLSEKLEKNWFDEFAYGLIMEEYLKAKIQEMKGDRRAMTKYLHIGRSIDKKWFEGELLVSDRSIARTALENLAKGFMKGK